MPPIRITRLHKDQRVHVFHRYSQDPNGYFMVKNKAMGQLHPSIGKTDGWTEAIATENWDVANFDVNHFETWPEIRWTYPLWYDKRGRKLDSKNPSMVTQRVQPEQIRLESAPEEASRQPISTFVFVRWGGAQVVDPVTEGVGGWGNIGSTCSDNFINSLEQRAFTLLGPTYEVISVFVQNSQELKQLSTPLLRDLCAGVHVGAFYFLWPIGFEDGHDYPGYVERDALFRLLEQNEFAGIPTRFPHCSHLYKTFASKEWAAQQCLTPGLNVPLTTKLSRSLISQNPLAAAHTAIDALQSLAKTRETWPGWENCNWRPTVDTGVTKLGYSWEAMDVLKWKNPKELATALENLVEQPGSRMDFAFVQEWIDFDVEWRHYIVWPNLQDPESLLPRKIVCTQFQEATSRGGFTDFNKFSLEESLDTVFQGDREAWLDAQTKSNALIKRWLHWLLVESSELPIVVRFDILVKRNPEGGTSRVYTGELTELGGCFLGWQEGPMIIQGAMVESVAYPRGRKYDDRMRHNNPKKGKEQGARGAQQLHQSNGPVHPPQQRSNGH